MEDLPQQALTASSNVQKSSLHTCKYCKRSWTLKAILSKHIRDCPVRIQQRDSRYRAIIEERQHHQQQQQQQEQAIVEQEEVLSVAQNENDTPNDAAGMLVG